MMNFLNNMNLIPKNFIVANIVDTLKDDPENGVEKVFEMADKFVKDSETLGLVEQVKDAYYTRQSIRMYAKNLIYNTEKSCLNNFIHNIVVKELLEGISKREQISQKYKCEIPHALVLNYEKKQVGELDRIIGQAKEMGIHLIILMNDGEHLTPIFKKYNDVQFLLFTTALSLTTKRCEELTIQGNILPMIITNDSATDLAHIKSSGLLYGMITLTDIDNYQGVTADEFILPLIRQGSRLNWYVTSATENLDKQKLLQLKHRVDYIRKMRPYLAIHLSSNKPFNDQKISGSLTVEEMVNQQLHTFTFPEITLQNSQGKSLLQVLKSL